MTNIIIAIYQYLYRRYRAMIQVNWLVFPGSNATKSDQNRLKCLVKQIPRIIKEDNNQQQNTARSIKKVRCKHQNFNINHKIHSIINTNQISQLEPHFKFPAKMIRLTSKQITISSIHNHSKFHIPCLYLQGSIYPTKTIIYFHGNAQDIFTSYNFVKEINQYTGLNIISVEYPGYSDYSGNTTARAIQEDAEHIVHYLQSQHIKLSDIYVLGRSIGTGPALHLASIFAVKGIILLSPFLSLKRLVYDLYGKLASMLFIEKFNNFEKARKTKSSCLIIHGKADKIIPYSHAIELSQCFKGYCKLNLIDQMTHSSFNFKNDFLIHMSYFLKMIIDNE